MFRSPFAWLGQGDSTPPNWPANGLSASSRLALTRQRTGRRGLRQRAVEGDFERLVDPVDREELELGARLLGQLLEIALVLARKDHLRDSRTLRSEGLLAQPPDWQDLPRERQLTRHRDLLR